MKKEKNEFINPMKELRNRYGMTQQEFSEKIGVKKTTITNIESGKHQISLRTQNDVAKAFNLYDDWFTGPNYEEKIDIGETMKDILKIIMNNVDNEKIARHILQNLKTIVDTDGLSKEEKKIYAEYIYVIIRDLAMATAEAKKHIKNEKVDDMAIKAEIVKNDIVKLQGVSEVPESEYIKICVKNESLLDDLSF